MDSYWTFAKPSTSFLSLLIQKMVSAGINAYIISWIQHFLTERKQQVVFRGATSTNITVTSGVPQGSVVGPKLFLLYINDLPGVVSCKVSLFADDTLVYDHVDTVAEASVFQKNIDALSKWSEQWGMNFNINKTQLLVFNRKVPDLHKSYTLLDSKINEVDYATYLGVILQNNLKFDLHIEAKINKASKVLGLLKRTLYIAPKKTKLLAYTTICRPILEYGCQVWDPFLKTQCNDIERIQNKAVRFICSIKGRGESVSLARQSLGLDTLENRRRQARLSLLSKILEDDFNVFNDFLDQYTNSIRTTIQTRHQSQGLLSSVVSNTSIFHQSFLPRTIRDSRSKPSADNN